MTIRAEDGREGREPGEVARREMLDCIYEDSGASIAAGREEAAGLGGTWGR